MPEPCCHCGKPAADGVRLRDGRVVCEVCWPDDPELFVSNPLDSLPPGAVDLMCEVGMASRELALLPDVRLADIRARCDAATAGPWHVNEDGSVVIVPSGTLGQGSWSEVTVGRMMNSATLNAPANAAFMAATREDVPALLAEVEHLRVLLAETERHRDNAVDDMAAWMGYAGRLKGILMRRGIASPEPPSTASDPPSARSRA